MNLRMVISAVIAMLWVLSLAAVYKSTSNSYEKRIADMNVQGLHQMLEQQKIELEKQNQIINKLTEVNKDAKQRNDKITADLNNANDTLSMFKQTINKLSRSKESGNTAFVDRSKATSATDTLVLGELLELSATRNIELATEADRARAAGITCEQQYEKVRNVINGTKN